MIYEFDYTCISFVHSVVIIQLFAIQPTIAKHD